MRHNRRVRVAVAGLALLAAVLLQVGEAVAGCNAPDGEKIDISIEGPSAVCEGCTASYNLSMTPGGVAGTIAWSSDGTHVTIPPGSAATSVIATGSSAGAGYLMATFTPDSPGTGVCTARLDVTVVKVEFPSSFDHVCTTAVHTASHQIDVDLTPTTPGVGVTLEITNGVPGSTGAAVFYPAGTVTKTITSSMAVTILGTEPSSVLTNMLLKAYLEGYPSCLCTSRLFTVVDATNLVAWEALHTSNETNDATQVDDTNTLYICQTSNDNAELEFQLWWTPSNYSSNEFLWDIVLTNGEASATQWNATNGNFAVNPTNSVWTNSASASGVTNREFLLRAWFDCDGGDGWDGSYPEPHRIVDVKVVDLVKLALTNALCTNAVADLTRADEPSSGANTLLICEGTNGTAEMGIQLWWLPDNVDSNRFLWDIVLTNGAAGATQWNATNGSFAVNPANVVWTNSASASGVTNREFLVRGWYDCDKDGTYTNTEPHRSLYATVIRLEDIEVVRTDPSPLVANPVLVTHDAFEATVTKEPNTRELLWSVAVSNYNAAFPVQLSYTVDVVTNVYTNTVVNMGSGGKIFLTVRDSESECCLERKVIRVGCYACSSGESGSCPVAAISASLSSIDVSFNLGRAAGGGDAGSLSIMASTPDPSLGSPASLIVPRERLFRSGCCGDVPVSHTWPEMDVIIADQMPRQVKTAEALADIQVLNDASYSIDFYSHDQVGAKSGGLYTFSGSEDVRYTITNLVSSGLKISELRGGNTIVTEYAYQSDNGTNTWTLSTGNGLRYESRSTFDDGLGNRFVIHEIANSTGENSYKAEETYQDFGWGYSIVEQVIDSDGTALTNAWFYYTDSGEAGKYGRVMMQVDADGSWRKYDYDGSGRTTLEISAFLDEGTNAAASEARAVYYDYTMREGEKPGYAPHRPRTVTETALGETNAVTFYYYATNTAGGLIEISERAGSVSAGYGDNGNLRTTRTYYTPATNAVAATKLETIEYPDGRQDSYEYGFTNFLAATDVRTVVTHGSTDHTEGVTNKTTRDISVSDQLGYGLYSQTEVYTGSGYEATDSTRWYRDELGRATNVAYGDGTYSVTEWACCGKAAEEDRHGIRTDYAYDDLKRVVTVTKQADTDLMTDYTYDTSGRRLTVKRYDGDLILVSSNQYDAAGRLTNAIDEAGLVTTYIYESGGRITTTIAPGNATKITETHKDGRTKSVTGNGVVHQYYEYGVNADGTLWTSNFTGPDGLTSPMWTKTTTDVLGRTIQEEKAGFDGSVITNLYLYNSKGQLATNRVSGLADTLYEYDELGNLIRSGLDLNGDGDLDLDGTDRVTESDTYYELDGAENWWRVSLTKVYPADGSGTPVTNSVQKVQLTGLSAGMTSYTVSIDVQGNETVTSNAVDRAQKTVTQAVFYPDSDSAAVTVTSNGLVRTSTTKTGLTYTYAYDGLERRTGVTDPRTGESTTGYNDKGQLAWETDPATNTTYSFYDADTGRRSAVSNALGEVTRYEYTARGELKRTWGDVPYPVSYAYDDYGRMETMATYRGGSGWNGATWPDPEPSADTNTWQYEEASGVLTNKLYADDKGTQYSYTSEGKLLTRTWARGATTTYSYDSCCGAMTNIDYSGSTPDIAFTYDRLGRQETVTDAQGTRTFSYDPDTLAVTNETIVVGTAGSVVRTNVLTRWQDDLGRPAGISLTLDGAASPQYTMTYSYDPDNGRFCCVTSIVAGVTNVFTYSYTNNSDLIAGYVATNPASGMSLETRRIYEQNRNLIAQVLNLTNGATLSQYVYGNDELGRRTNRVDTLDSVITNSYAYNMRSELANAVIASAGSSDSFEYEFDNIGNRETYTTNSTTWTYLVNQLNQYTSIADGVTNTPTYDADGNMLTCGDWTFTWNDENRLIKTESAASVPEAAKVKVENLYDYMGRRVRKTVSSGYSGGSYTTTNVTTFIYDGWLPIAEITDDGSIVSTNYHIWGIDASGSLQGAGGVGGLLATIQDGETYFACMDGNGNVCQYVDTNGTVVAAREFDPFGGTIALTGTKKDDFNFWFSTHYLDSETGQYNAKRRYYSSALGRFLSRDSIEEQGGLNLYGYVDNDAINHIDPFGKWKAPQHRSFTGSAFFLSLFNTSLDGEITGGVRSEMEQRLKDANDDQDSLWPIWGNLWKHRRHYGGIKSSSPSVADRQTLNTAYENYLDWETGEFLGYIANPSKSNCKKALKSLGFLSHSWQDFYAHAIRRDFGGPTTPSGGSENSTKPGFTAFSVGVTGNPDARGNFWPCTYHVILPGREHGRLWEGEPIEPGTMEYTVRTMESVFFTESRFDIWIPRWWDACECYAKEMWAP